MYANFYYHIPSKTYGRGPWRELEEPMRYCPFYEHEDLVYIGEVYDQDLFTNELVIEPSYESSALAWPREYLGPLG